MAYCSLAIQRQLELTKETLSQNDPDKRYCYKLIQFESQLRKVHERELQYLENDHKGKKKKQIIHPKSGKYKPTFERVAITAYFKRTPVSKFSAVRTLEKEERRQRAQQLRMPPPFRSMFLPSRPVGLPIGG
ncbi:hypothetical protein B0J13DRAFT_560633 [Dactylonectria estremocensis]|uniref:Uncharacterized protein n=1 Tax=Dactylonectria estremocensis TaxID=1079267 RepID=A0A9P9ECD4_9HYPO|nr:hypothetical protein B0J13DRAFT_560633 [Dactylonectria estremocensis]